MNSFLPQDRTGEGRKDADLWTRASEDPADRLLSEDHCLALINELFPERSNHFFMQRNDDCAELIIEADSPFDHAAGEVHGHSGSGEALKNTVARLALSTDYFVEDVHFRAAYFTPEEAGAKALSSAISDLAAAGAIPQGFSLGLMLPEGMSVRAVRRFLAGMAETARRHALTLTGGDLTKAPIRPISAQGTIAPPRGGPLTACITVWGTPAAPGIPFLRRQQSRPGDCLFLIGPTGLARAGLSALEQLGRERALAAFPLACRAHLAPAIHVREGRRLALMAKRHGPFSLMDCSDGLVRDLPRLLGAYGADLTFTALPFSQTAAAELAAFAPPPLPQAAATESAGTAQARQTDLESFFLLGGEDYALIGACPEASLPALIGAFPDLFVLGAVTEQPGIHRHGRPLSPECRRGFDHFS